MKYTIAVRIMWPGGVFRTALEEARYMKARLIILRKSKKETPYDTNNVDLCILRDSKKKGKLTPLFELLTLLYDKERGKEATVDLDLIFKLQKMKLSNTLYFDQFIAIAGYINKILYKIPYNVFLHETVLGRKNNFRSLFLVIFDRIILKNADLVITNSAWNKKVLKRYGINSHVAYLGCTPSNNLNLKRSKKIVTVSMWDRFRNPEIYVKLAREVKLEVIIAGSWTTEDYMKEFIEKYGSIVKVTGPVNEAELDELYKTSMFYIRFGYEERGPGLGGLEALGHGTPVITNRSLGISEIIIDGYNGFVVDDVDEAIQKINAIIDDEDRMKVMMENAYATGIKYSWYNHARRVEEILNRKILD
ncbi:MAG: glycosyltransferase family 4 protein [Nitrososphaeria archaeon]